MSPGNPSRDLLIQYWIRAIRIGVQATALVLVALALLLVLPGDGRVRPAPFAIILAMAGAGGLVVSVLPWPRLFESAWGLRCLYAWSVTDILLISLGVAVSGGARSELFIGYALTTVFFGACYPRPAHPVLLAFTFGCYLAVLGLTGWDISPAALALRLMMLGTLALITSFLSGELLRRAHANDEARANAEQWAALLSSVASAGRSMTLDPKRVVEVAVDSALALGFEGAGLCVLDEEARSWRLVHARGLPDSYVRTHATAHASTDGIVGLVLRSGTTCTLVKDSPGSETLPLIGDQFAAVVASPIWVAGWLACVLVAASHDQDLSPQELEAFELLAAQAGLALENARRYEQERRNVERLEELDSMKSDFLATVSHELRTPLTVIEGTGLTLERSWNAIDEDTRSDLLSALNANAKTLEEIITKLLDFSRLEAGHPEVRLGALDIGEQIKQTASRLAGLFGDRDLIVVIEPDLLVSADALLVDRVIENLLSNAFKHTSARTLVELSARREGAEVVVTVRDEGPGIPDEELAHLGERFFRGGNLNTRPKGLGLGLALVREVLDLHGSELEVESQLGRGSRFSFRLPAIQADLPASEAAMEA